MNQPNTGSSNDHDQITPRLFRLRDLHPSKNPAKSPAAPSVVAPQVQAEPPFQAEQTTLQYSPASAESHGIADEPGMTNQTAYESSEQLKSRERIERHLDASPEGRSWMESALAHRKVLVLLLLAISAALWTSREDASREGSGQQQANPDSELSLANGTLEFDPTQFDAGTLVDEGQDFFPTENTVDSGSQGLAANTNSNASNSNASSPAIAENSPALASNSLVPNPVSTTTSSAASTRLSEPLAATGDENASAGNVAIASSAPNTEPAMSQIHSTGLTVEAVSSRTPRDPVFNVASSANSAEPDNDMLNVVADTAPRQQETELTLQNSTTPNGVADWLKYLPAQP
ncbi:hypothetical protein LF1_30930 [Rubripirellula obstinata]|uniref:Uncharacterized protein n=1 Tax=Rubripirellula obstinata TaxID=406547 RepID=A0A5B1CMH7_9BACT|nr:hypothetical protein [Rubripirellula obstinata]KAA1260553.1 hypothetical protein LF1_30930 [Rubripirellula obstinata]